MVAPWRWFARSFGAAAIAHLAGNPVGWRGDEFGFSPLLVVASALLGAARASWWSSARADGRWA